MNCALRKPRPACFKSFKTLPERVVKVSGKKLCNVLDNLCQSLLIKKVAKRINTIAVAAPGIHETSDGRDDNKSWRNEVILPDNLLLASLMLLVIVSCLLASKALNFEAIPS